MKAKWYKAEFTEEWLKGNPDDRGREIIGHPKKGDDRFVSVLKIGQKTVQSYSKDFVKLSDSEVDKKIKK